jgi:hypothetical protein
MRRAAALALLLAACAGMSRAPTPGHAVVLHEPSRAADAERAREILAAHGWDVTTAPAGVARRSRSSLAIYAQRKRDPRGRDLADALRPAIGELDVLPFLTDGPGGQDAVLWLADAASSRD